MLRSYLGKAWSHTTDATRAQNELGLAKQFDPNDPTPWLYSALLNEQQNRVNDAVSDLEKSKELNDNRSVFRSRLLLDQDKAVRGANLARLYSDAGLFDWSFREASRAVSYDYANFSAHQFLANSYDALRDPKAINLRYEAPAASEYFIATLLSPVGATPLSQNVSQQEYTRLFEGDHFGVASSTEYFSNGDWIQQESQYGRYGPIDYSLEGYYQYDNGQRPNNTVERTDYAARFRAQLTTKDTLYFEAQRSELESGDVVQYYDQSSASRKLRLKEVQEPNLFVGYHREWAPGVHTLFLGMRIEDDFRYSDPFAFIPFFKSTEGPITRILPTTDKVRVRSQFEGYSAELQQIFATPMNTLILGGRFQYGTFDNFNAISNRTDVFGPFTTKFDNETHLRRESLYAYDQWSPWQQFQLTVGVTYDRLDFPENNDTPPYASTEDKEEKFSPKVGFIWTPEETTHVRGAYTRSLGGVFFDNSRRLEPTQVGGFNQTYRSIAPESALGIAPATSFETFSIGVDHRFPTRTYVNLDAEWLRSDGDRTIGTLSNISVFPTVETTGRALQKIEYDERSIALSVNQLIGRDWAFGVRYRISEADAETRFGHVSPAVANPVGANRDDRALLQQLRLSLIYNLPCGFFAQAESIYTHQHFEDDLSGLDGDDFWQVNLFAGYRFWQRHAEARVGVLNIGDRDYKLHPLNLYSELPRERTFYASFKFYF
jgi:hypothetical protein